MQYKIVIIIISVPTHAILGIRHSTDILEESEAFLGVWASV
jgi:hypothetical protein